MSDMPMTIVSDLKDWGPAVTLVLATLLLSKELLNASGRTYPRLRWLLNALVIPLLIVFLVQIVLLVLTG